MWYWGDSFDLAPLYISVVIVFVFFFFSPMSYYDDIQMNSQCTVLAHGPDSLFSLPFPSSTFLLNSRLNDME